MSKENKQTITKANTHEKKHSKLQWFLFVIVIPFLFSIAVLLVVLTMSGINVFDLVEEYSDTTSIVSDFTDGVDQEESTLEEVANLKATIEDQKFEIENLKSDINHKQTELDTYQQRIEELTTELKILQEKENEMKLKLNEIASVYETMSAKKAAAIFSEMPTTELLDIVVVMNVEARASILEKMDPAKAAEVMLSLKQQEETVTGEQPKTANN